MKDSSYQSIKRPLVITIFCLLGFISLPWVLLSVIMPEVREGLIQQYGQLYIWTLSISSTLGLAGLIGLWKMKKWGVYIYAAMALLSTASGWYNGVAFNFGYVFPLVVMVIAWANINKMN